MVSRSPRYFVSCSYVHPISKDKICFGTLDEKLMTTTDLEYLLKILSPSNCWSWIENIKGLRRNDYIDLEIKDVDLVKMLKIRRH